MSKNRTQPPDLLDLKDAVDFIGRHYVAGWAGNEIKAPVLPDPDTLKRFLTKLKQQCAEQNRDYRKYANTTGKSRRVIRRSTNHISSLTEQFDNYSRALSKYDFSERIPKQFKDDYAAYKRQFDALQILRNAIKIGLTVTFINAQNGESKIIHPITADKSDLRFNLYGGTIKYYEDTGYLSIERTELQEAITAKRSESVPHIISGITKTTVEHNNPNAEWWTEKQVASYLNLSLSTLHRWRVEGNKQLPFVKFGKSVRYAKSDVEVYANSNKHNSTSDF